MKNFIKDPTTFQSLYALEKKGSIDLSLSENPLGCSPIVLKSLKRMSKEFVSEYMSPDNSALKESIAKRCKVQADSIFIGNGSESIIKTLPQALLDKTSEVVIPTIISLCLK